LTELSGALTFGASTTLQGAVMAKEKSKPKREPKKPKKADKKKK
jgi:hypothetical protein